MAEAAKVGPKNDNAKAVMNDLKSILGSGPRVPVAANDKPAPKPASVPAQKGRGVVV